MFRRVLNLFRRPRARATATRPITLRGTAPGPGRYADPPRHAAPYPGRSRAARHEPRVPVRTSGLDQPDEVYPYPYPLGHPAASLDPVHGTGDSGARPSQCDATPGESSAGDGGSGSSGGSSDSGGRCDSGGGF